MVNDAGRDESMKNPVIEISCVEVWREISSYIDGDLDSELKARLELHLKNCKDCRAVLQGTSNTVRLLTDGDWYPLPEGFSERLFARLSSEYRSETS
jgi:anti-sigma factor RsiW